MISIDADHLDHKALNDRLRGIKAPIQLTNCCGQRFIAAGMAPVSLSITGVPGNALGAYLNGGKIVVHGNAQDAVGDTMNNGTIIVHGSIGDAAGYAMRGGKIYVKGNAGYRAGIHIKAYEDKSPTIIIGGTCGSFLGEYQAGGTIIVLGLTAQQNPIVSNFPCTGMHGGTMYLRGSCDAIRFPQTVEVSRADAEDIAAIDERLTEFCTIFSYDKNVVMEEGFTKIVPSSSNPYKALYVTN